MTTSSTEHKKEPLVIRILGPIIVLACFIFTILNGAKPITQEVLKYHLQEFSENFSKQASLNGKIGTFSYGDVSIKGWGFDKYAVIENASISVAEHGLLHSSKWTLSTASVIVTPDSFIEGLFVFSFPDPLNIIENSELRSLVTFPRPPKYSYLEGRRGRVRVLEHALFLPEKMTFTPSRSVDDTRVTEAEQTIVSFDANPTIKSVYQLDDHARSIDIAFKNVSVTKGESVRAMINSLSSSFSEKQTGEKEMGGNYLLQVIDLMLPVGENMMNPYNITASFATSSQLSEPFTTLKSGVVTLPMATRADIAINALDILTTDFGVRIKGHITDDLEDPLIFGNANIDINNVKKFIGSELIPQHARGAFSMAIAQVVGQPVDQLVDTVISVRREKNGGLYFNDMPFEKVAAALFSDLLKGAPDDDITPMEIAPPEQEETTLPATSPRANAPAGAAPYAPVISAPVPPPPPLTAVEKVIQEAQ